MNLFTEDWLVARQQKQASWAAQGKKTGSGGVFGSEIKVFGANTPSAINKTAKKTSKKTNPKPDNPHAVALAKLANNPDLMHRAGEHWEQVRFFDWLYRNKPDFYDDFASVPNGGHRHKKTANDLTDEGLKSGYPDITGDVPKGKYHGLFIELKKGKNVPSDNQIAQLNRKTFRGYFAALCYGVSEVVEVVSEYLALAPGTTMEWAKNEEKWKVEND